MISGLGPARSAMPRVREQLMASICDVGGTCSGTEYSRTVLGRQDTTKSTKLTTHRHLNPPPAFLLARHCSPSARRLRLATNLSDLSESTRTAQVTAHRFTQVMIR